MSFECPIIISKLKMMKALQWLKADKALGPDGISNQILQASAKKLSKLLVLLFQACVTHTYHF